MLEKLSHNKKENEFWKQFERRIQTIAIRNAGLLYIIIDSDNKINQIAHGLTNLLGFEDDQELKRNFNRFQFVHQKDRESVETFFNSISQADKLTESTTPSKDHDSVTYRVFSSDSTILWIRSTAQKLVIDGEERKIHTFQNITEQVSREKKLEKTIQSLAIKREKQSELFSIIGHELRTPIAAIKMLADDMELSQMSDEGQQLCETTDSLIAVLEDLRYVVQPELVKRIVLENERPFLVIERSLNMLKGMLREHKINMHLSSNENASNPVKLASQQLRQMVINLVKNAVIHAEATDIWVNISGIKKTEACINLTVTVEDNGTGIKGKKRFLMFEAFSRGESDADGTGLGLFISKSLADSLNGEIEYFDSEHGGAGFRISFDVDSSVDTEIINNQTKQEKELKNLQILFVEDQLTLQLLTSKQLEKQGAITVGATDGVDALKSYETNKFDLIITDINMPNMNGYELTKTLRQKGYKGPIIGVTAAFIGKETEQLLAAGADSVITKPISIELLKHELWKFERNSSD